MTVPKNPLILRHRDVFYSYDTHIARSRIEAWDEYVRRSRDLGARPRFPIARAAAYLRSDRLFELFHVRLLTNELLVRAQTMHETSSGLRYPRYTRRGIDERTHLWLEELDDEFHGIDELERLMRG